MTEVSQEHTLESRKGIYQEFDAQGNIMSDERWRFAPMHGGGVRIDIEVVRIAPFSEPRHETITLQLGKSLDWQMLAAHALHGRRECRADFTAQHVDLCWRQDEVSRTREISWSNDCEIDYNSPLFSTVALWRHHVATGETWAVNAMCLDHVTFEPRWLRETYTCLGAEQHETRFGMLRLDHYQRDAGGERKDVSDFWCDQAGVIFDYVTSSGSGYRLAAVNFTV